MKQQKPIIHGRDHEHGGADPIRVHWEDVGTSGGGAGGGIRFDTYPQAGGWLYLETTDSTGEPSASGIEIQDKSGGGVLIVIDDGDTVHTPDLIVDAGRNIQLTAHEEFFAQGDNISGGFGVELESGLGGMWLHTSATPPAPVVPHEGIEIRHGKHAIQLRDELASRGIHLTVLATGPWDASGDSKLYLTGHLRHRLLGASMDSRFQITSEAGTPIFEVRETSGTVSYHIKSGASWTADL